MYPSSRSTTGSYVHQVPNLPATVTPVGTAGCISNLQATHQPPSPGFPSVPVMPLIHSQPEARMDPFTTSLFVRPPSPPQAPGSVRVRAREDDDALNPAKRVRWIIADPRIRAQRLLDPSGSGCVTLTDSGREDQDDVEIMNGVVELLYAHKLSTLTIESLHVTEKKLKRLHRALCSTSSLKTLVVDGLVAKFRKGKSNGLALFMDAIQANKVIQRIVWRCRFVEHFSPVLRTNSTIKSLTVDNDQWTRPALAALMKALEANQSIEHLAIESSPPDPQDHSLQVELLMVNPRIKDVAFQSLNDSALSTLVNAFIEGKCRLTSFVLSSRSEAWTESYCQSMIKLLSVVQSDKEWRQMAFPLPAIDFKGPGYPDDALIGQALEAAHAICSELSKHRSTTLGLPQGLQIPVPAGTIPKDFTVERHDPSATTTTVTTVTTTTTTAPSTFTHTALVIASATGSTLEQDLAERENALRSSVEDQFSLDAFLNSAWWDQ